MLQKLSSVLVITALCFTACKKEDANNVITPVVDSTSNPIPSPARENFESGSKDNFEVGTATLSTGKWSFDNAILAGSAEDKKNGAKSARLQGNGRITMNFDIVNGVVRVAVSSGSYSNDGPVTWQLWASYNSGSTYAQVGTDITTSGAGLRTDTIMINTVGKVRFSVRKLSASGSLNIDDIDAILTSGPLAPNFTDNNHMLLGNPSSATASPVDYSNYYMDKVYYSVSYNSELSKPNWVSWHLGTSDLGSTPRQDDFRPDDNLPSSWYRVTDQSYTGTGFDRGHSCPSNDRTSSVPANSSTFLMTNIFPQAPNVNQGPWAKFEDSCNRLVTSLGKEVYIECGTYGVGGTGNNGTLLDIDNNRISVPAQCWKIAVVLSNGNGDLGRINSSTRVIAVVMPNDNAVGIGASWKNYRVSVDAIEAATGYNLLSNLPDAVQQALESQVDNL